MASKNLSEKKEGKQRKKSEQGRGGIISLLIFIS